jgi:membrane protease YdiL (CAAX protease family)
MEELEDSKVENQVNDNVYDKNKIRDVNIVFLISTFLQFFVGSVLYAAILVVFEIVKSIDINKIYYYYLSPFIEVIAIFLPVVFYYLISKADYKYELRLNKIKLKHIIPFIIIGISAQYVGGFLNSFIIIILQQLGKVPITQDIPVPANIYELFYTIFVIAAIPALFEELFSRGLVQRAYESYGVKWSIILSAVLFGTLHYDLENFIFPVFFGLILAYVVYKTNSIFAGIIIHFTNNALASLLLYLYPSDASTKYYETYTLSDMLSFGVLVLISLLFLCGSLYYIYKTCDKNDNVNIDFDIQKMPDKKISFKNYWPVLICIIILIISFVTSVLEII